MREVKQWTTDAVEELRGCMECTDWDVFFSPGDSLDHTATVISDYIAFCEDMIIPKKLVKSFPNSKPWITKELKKKTVSQKRDAYLKKDSEEGKRIQTELKRHIRDAKAEYKDNIELQFKGGNMRDAWRGLKTLAGQTQPQAKDFVSSLSEQTDRAVKCNDFYYRFDRFDFTAKLSQVLDRVRQNIYTYVNDTEVEEITPKVVHRELNNTWIKLDLFVRILFIDYSSAFNTIQPYLLAEKLFSLNVRPKLIVWLIDFLVNRSQVVRYQNVLSQVKATSTSAPRAQFCHLCFSLYILTISGAVAPCAACTSTRMTLPWQNFQIQTVILSSRSLK